MTLAVVSGITVNPLRRVLSYLPSLNTFVHKTNVNGFIFCALSKWKIDWIPVVSIALSLSIITLKFKSIEMENKKIEYFP